MLPPGYRFSDLTITKLLGRGGFGQTYLAREEKLGCDVAVKEYLPEQYAYWSEGKIRIKPGFRDDWDLGKEDFKVEAQKMALFNHRNIVRVKRYIEAHGTAYIVMDYIRGRSLNAWYMNESKGSVSQADFDHLLKPLLDALAEMHKNDIFHRDIKLDNIMISTKGEPIIIDFGAAKASTYGRSQDIGRVVSAPYSPIELYQTTLNRGPWNDIYSLGVTLHRLLTGTKLPNAPSRFENPQPLNLTEISGYRHGFLKGLEYAVEVYPKNRPQSVEELRDIMMKQSEPEKENAWRRFLFRVGVLTRSE